MITGALEQDTKFTIQTRKAAFNESGFFVGLRTHGISPQDFAQRHLRRPWADDIKLISLIRKLHGIHHGQIVI
jgi:hypothetical protein